MKRKAGNAGKSWSSEGMKNAAPPAPPSGPPQKIRLVQDGSPTSKPTKSGPGGPSSGKTPAAKKGAAGVPPAKKGRR
jgi:hypothetical protein